MSTTLRELLARGWRVMRVRGHESSPRVDRLMDSLRAPASPRDLAREDDAVAAFDRARLVSPTPLRSNEMSPRAARTGVKAALASAGVVALLSTGAAFAAGGHAPWSRGAAGEATSHTATTRTAHPTHPVHPTHPAKPSAGSSMVGGPKAHAFNGLCRAYAAGSKATHGQALSQSGVQRPGDRCRWCRQRRGLLRSAAGAGPRFRRPQRPVLGRSAVDVRPPDASDPPDASGPPDAPGQADASGPPDAPGQAGPPGQAAEAQPPGQPPRLSPGRGSRDRRIRGGLAVRRPGVGRRSPRGSRAYGGPTRRGGSRPSGRCR